MKRQNAAFGLAAVAAAVAATVAAALVPTTALARSQACWGRPAPPGASAVRNFRGPTRSLAAAKLNKLTVKVDRPHLCPADIAKLQAAQWNNKTSE